VADTERRQSERWFESYCDAHSISVLAYEPDLGAGKRPDYLIAKDEVEVVCEVKEFEATAIDRLRELRQAFTTSQSVELKPIRGQVREAARQLKPLAGSKWPLVVVLANPRGFHVPLDADSLIHALYGDLTITFEIGPDGGAVSEPRWGAGRGGRLRNDHPYISAVAALHRGDLELDWWNDWYARERSATPEPETYEEAFDRWRARAALAERVAKKEEIPTGDYFRVDVVRNWSTSAVPLPADVFAGARDTLWAFEESEAAYVKVR
jgi:hypothetical protein